MTSGVTGSHPLDDCQVSFDSFHSGETPKTASSCTKFFPIDSNDALNTPTGMEFTGQSKNPCESGRLFFADDFSKRLSNLGSTTDDSQCHTLPSLRSSTECKSLICFYVFLFFIRRLDRLLLG
ncbi:putative early growth response protein [Fasciolopsis buskii]|uniref:Putative early growth response protein n=1 Tax=Fasciolopsis buskii TaxID=27845 RepID=A0A8E0VHQ8_9TREM|nr:putative early growth response protein [Fasciolopsis buski]